MLLKRRDTFLYVTRGLMRYDGAETWPELLLAPDVSIHTAVHPFHWLPGSRHRFRVVRVAEELMEIDTVESVGRFQPLGSGYRRFRLNRSRTLGITRPGVDVIERNEPAGLFGLAFIRLFAHLGILTEARRH